MRTSRIPLALGLISLMSAAAARDYGPQDEGRRFSDGSKVECRNVEVHKNSRDPNRVAGTAIGAVVGGLLGGGRRGARRRSGLASGGCCRAGFGGLPAAAAAEDGGAEQRRGHRDGRN